MELGRELFQQWGYRRVDELVWVKTSQLGRLIRTGRTGHWLKCVPPPSPDHIHHPSSLLPLRLILLLLWPDLSLSFLTLQKRD